MADRKVAILGASGQLGRQLVTHYPDAYTPTHEELDISEPDSIKSQLSGYDMVINCAAMHDLKECHENPAKAMYVNAATMLVLASVVGKVIYISTNYVFDGLPTTNAFDATYHGYSEMDRPQPINIYGASKRAGELIVLALNKRNLVIRTAGLYGPGGPSGKSFNFVDAVKAGKYTKIKYDEWSNQTSCIDLARGIKRNELTSGILHLVNTPAMTWFDFANLIGRDGIEPVSSNDMHDWLQRPKFGGMRSIFNTGMMGTEDALREYIELVYPD